MPKIAPLQAFSLGADAAYLIRRDPPIAPDGQYDWQAGDDANTSSQGHSTVTNLVQKVDTFAKKSEGFKPDPKLVVRISRALVLVCITS
jgi:linoleate 10R-lipoxygenase